MEELNFVQRYEPDKARLIEKINRLKGSRTSAEFTKIVNEKYSAKHGENILSTPTFSRILNASFKGSLSPKLIYAMLDASESPVEEYEVTGIFRANGMEREDVVKKEEQEQDNERDENYSMRSKKYEQRRIAMVNNENMIRNRILEFSSDSSMVSRTEMRQVLNNSNGFRIGRFYYDAVIKLDDSGNDYWAFEVAPYVHKESDIRMVMGHWEDRSLMCFLLDHWEPEKLERIKMSFVFTQRESYDEFVNLLKDKKVNNDFSILLFDTNTKDFVEEFKIARYDGTVCKSPLDDVKPTDLKISKKALKVVSGVNDKFASLDDTERKVVCLASGIYDGKCKSMEEIAEELDISVNRASSIYESAMNKLAE